MSKKRWYHVVTHNACFGFAINENFIVTDVAPIGYAALYGKSVKDPNVRNWFVDKIVIEVIASQTNDDGVDNREA